METTMKIIKTGDKYSTMETTMKRSLDDDSETDAKRIKIESENILLFSDCVLSMILSYLKPYDLYCLSKTCQRFKYLIKEKKFWRKIDVRDQPMCAKKFKFFFDNVNNNTDAILVSGISKKEKTLTFSQFITMYKTCENLTILAIENQYINSDEIGLKDFPRSLKELSLRGTHIYGRQPFLQDANLHLHKLHTLILDDCKWFHEHSLMALSKLCSLENLSLYKCGNLNDSVAYMSITAKFGFRKLLRIDARCTSIGDQFLKCFHCIKTLREIYLEAPKRRETKAKPLFDEIKRLYSSDLQDSTSAVVFNRNNIFKLRRERMKPKRPKKYCVHQMRESNCLENCQNCSIETCSIIAPSLNPPSPIIPPSAPLQQEGDCNNQNNGTPLPRNVIICESDNLCSPSSSICESRVDLASDADQPSSSKFPPEESAQPPSEVFYCDDVSDSEDEIVDFEIFHSDVTDSGVQWFCTADPDATDDQGHESVLFRKPYRDCTCKKIGNGFDSFDQPGPSGLNDVMNSQPPPPPPPPPEPPRVQNNARAQIRLLPDPPLRGRDLRVIIERLDPGVHIVYEQGGRVHFDNQVRDYTTQLKVFVARGYQHITNHALRSLMDLRLELLDVTGTSVSPMGVRDFLMVNPDCRVIHESTCRCGT